MASKASFICIKLISKQWSFSGSEGQLTDTGSQGRTFLSQKTSGSFGAVKKAADTESASGYSVILKNLKTPDTGNRLLSPWRNFPFNMTV